MIRLTDVFHRLLDSETLFLLALDCHLRSGRQNLLQFRKVRGLKILKVKCVRGQVDFGIIENEFVSFRLGDGRRNESPDH